MPLTALRARSILFRGLRLAPKKASYPCMAPIAIATMGRWGLSIKVRSAAQIPRKVQDLAPGLRWLCPKALDSLGTSIYGVHKKDEDKFNLVGT
jgi:hypothetical protein